MQPGLGWIIEMILSLDIIFILVTNASGVNDTSTDYSSGEDHMETK